MSALDFINNLGLSPDPDDPPQRAATTANSSNANEPLPIPPGALPQEDKTKQPVASSNASSPTTTTVTPTPEQQRERAGSIGDPDDPPQRAGITGNPHVSDGSTIPHEQYLAAEQIALQSEKPKVDIPDWIKNTKLAQELIDKGVNPDWPTLVRAHQQREQYKKDNKTMHATPGADGYFAGYDQPTFEKALGGVEGWKKFFDINDADFKTPEGRQQIENALITKFGSGFNGLMADGKFGPFHLDFLLNELMKDPGEGEQPRPNDPGRPQDPNRPERPNGELPDLQFYYENGYNPLMAYFDRKRPVSDERIRRAAAAAATTEAMQSLAQMIVGENAPVTKNENTVTPKLIERLQGILDNERKRDDTDLKSKRDAVMQFLDMAYKEREKDKDRPEDMFKTDLDQFNKDRNVLDDRYNKDRDVSDTRYENDRTYGLKKDQFNRELDWNKEKTNMEIEARKQMQNREIAASRDMLERQIQAGRYNKGTGAKLKPNVPVKGKDGKINPAAMTDDLVTQVNTYLSAEAKDNPQIMLEMKKYEAMLPKGMPPKEKMKAIAAMFFDRYMDIDDKGNITPKNGGSTDSWTGWYPGSDNSSSGNESNNGGEDESLWN